MDKDVCMEHSGMCAKIESLEERVDKMESKLNWIIGLLIINLGSILSGLLTIILKTKGG